MCVGRADKFISGQVCVLLKKLFPCRVRTEFKSLAFQVFGDESELRENAETGFVDMGRDEDAVQCVDGTFDRVYIDIQGRDQESFFLVCDLFFGIHHDLVTEFVRVVFYIREVEIEEVLECGKAFQGGEVCKGVNFFRRVDFRPTKNP